MKNCRVQRKILEEMGLPAFNSGIKIVPRALLATPEKILKKGAEEEKQRGPVTATIADNIYML